MKRLFAAILLLIIIFSFGCIRTASLPEPTDPTIPTEAQQVEEVSISLETDTVAAAVMLTPMPTPEPTNTPEPSDTPEPTSEPTEPPASADATQRYIAKDGVYTIAWISDPQYYSRQFPDYYYAMTEFLRDHREEMNLEYIIHTGDLVDGTNDESQWRVAVTAQSYIDDIPNGVLAGNHDVKDPHGYKYFCKYFGEKHYADKPWYGGSFEDNRGHFDLLTVGNTDYIFVYMGFSPNGKAYEWVRKTFLAYPDRIGVLCLHDYYTKTQTLSKDGQKWYDQVVKCTPNVYMVLCGHKYGAYCFPEEFDTNRDGKGDRTVYQMLFNYQASLHDGGGGYLRLIQIDEAEGTMHVLTYSPVLEDFNRFDDPQNREDYYPFDEKNEEFTLPLPWKIEHNT